MWVSMCICMCVWVVRNVSRDLHQCPLYHISVLFRPSLHFPKCISRFMLFIIPLYFILHSIPSLENHRMLCIAPCYSLPYRRSDQYTGPVLNVKGQVKYTSVVINIYSKAFLVYQIRCTWLNTCGLYTCTFMAAASCTHTPTHTAESVYSRDQKSGNRWMQKRRRGTKKGEGGDGGEIERRKNRGKEVQGQCMRGNGSSLNENLT